MQIVAVGVSHKRTTIDLRERLAVAADELRDMLVRLRDVAAEGFILSTCNRVELYAVCGHEASGAERLRELLAAHGNVPVQTIRDATYAYGHRVAVQHLLRVAAGLDSMVVGETEILGQVRRALAAARDAGTVSSLLDRLGDAALACGKRVRASGALGPEIESVASLGVDLLARQRGGLDGALIVVIGAGEMADRALHALGELSGARIIIVNRSHDRASALATTHGVDARPWDQLADVVAAADVIIACTAAPSPVIDATTLSRGPHAQLRPVFCLDLGVPRDIDPGVAALPGVTVIDAAQIEAEARRRPAHGRDVARAEAIVTRETDRYMEWWRGRGVASTVARLHLHAESIRDAEVERALLRLRDLPPQAQAIVRELGSRVVAKLLHHPTLALKSDPEAANLAVVVERLFALGEDATADDLSVAACSADRRHHSQESIAS